MGKVEYALKTLLYPVPVLLVSSGMEDGRSSIMTAGWTGAVCTDPPMVEVSIRPSRASCRMIRDFGAFVLNLNAEAVGGMALPPGRIYEPIRDRHRPRMVRRLENQWK